MTRETSKSDNETPDPTQTQDGDTRTEETTADGQGLTEALLDEDRTLDPSQDDQQPPEADSLRGEETGSGLEEELMTLQEEMDRVRDQHLRLAADFENYRKRVASDLSTGWVRAQADLVRSLVEGLDDLQRVSQFTSEDTTVEALIEGVDLVERKILKALTDAGLEVLVPEGEVFDPNTMEAMMRVPTEEPDQDEMVHQVFQKGYLFKDQLVRPARVSVFKDDD